MREQKEIIKIKDREIEELDAQLYTILEFYANHNETIREIYDIYNKLNGARLDMTSYYEEIILQLEDNDNYITDGMNQAQQLEEEYINEH